MPSPSPTFDLEQLGLLSSCLHRSEALVASAYKIPALPSVRYPYEVLTLADLTDPADRAPSSFAHLTVYARPRPRGLERLYRICLQDDVILERMAFDPVGGAGSGWLRPLLVNILTHELVHVVRFQTAEESFEARGERREREEDLVHRITPSLLGDAGEPAWKQLDAR
jgi:hypothetical protein